MEKVNKLFEEYLSLKNDEYSLRDGARASANIIKKGDCLVDQDNEGKSIYTQEFLERYSPDNIDVGLFWKNATKIFKYYSIISSNNIKSIKQLNELSLSIIHTPCLRFLDGYVLSTNSEKIILEIGPGYGCVKKYIKKRYGLKNYYAIDVNPLFKYKKLYKCNGSSIPNEIPKVIDVVYSVNVFQHLSKKQRTSYFNKIAERLKLTGLFIFSMFSYTDETKEILYNGKKLFGSRDKDGKVYTSFFSQFTEIDKVDDVCAELKSLGFFVKPVQRAANSFDFICMKLF